MVKDKKMILTMHLYGLFGFIIGGTIIYSTLPFGPYLNLIFAVTPGGLAGYVATLACIDAIYRYVTTRKANKKLALQK